MAVVVTIYFIADRNNLAVAIYNFINPEIIFQRIGPGDIVVFGIAVAPDQSAPLILFSFKRLDLHFHFQVLVFEIVGDAYIKHVTIVFTRLFHGFIGSIGSDHPKACILPDIYHLYKGGSGFNGLKMLSSTSVHVFHLNDYPASPPRETITDADRVYPGDGIAPLTDVFRELKAMGFKGVLSIELFNHSYYAQDAFLVAKTALEKLKAAVARG